MAAVVTMGDYPRLLTGLQACSAQERRKHLRYLARTDLYFLLRYLMNRKDVEHQWLFARCREVQREPNGHLDLWSREHYKDIADSTPVLTANRGWTTHGELLVGDYVFSPSGRTVHVLALSERYTDSACRKITFSDGAAIVAGAGHLWRVREKHKRRISGTDARLVEWSEGVIRTDDMPLRADVGAIESQLEFPPKQLAVDPYVLGVWLGDGNTGGTRITSGHSDAEEMESLLRSRGVEVNVTAHSNSVSLRVGSGIRGKRTSSDFANALGQIGVYRSKHIPREYLEASAHQRMLLLRGLMDTDGHCSARGTATFVNTNKSLADGVYELAVGLAMRPRWREYSNEFGPVYSVAFQAHEDRNPFALKRKADRAIKPSTHRNCRDVVSIEPIDSVPTRCIQVEGGMYLVGRELIPTHNSTIITFAKTIQDILASHGEDALTDRELTAVIFAFNRPAAKKFMEQIKQEFESNLVLKELFDDVLYQNPQAQSQHWSLDGGIVVQRRGNPKEATLEAYGLVDGMPTGGHWLLRVYDDVITERYARSPEMVAKSVEAWELSIALGAMGGVERYVGTRYHFNDAYKAIMDRGSAKARVYPATANGKIDGPSVFMTEEELAKRRRDMGRATFSAQMLQNPTADDAQTIDREDIQWYDGKTVQGNRYLLVDPAGEQKKSSDYTVIVLLELGADGNVYLLDGIRDRLRLKDRAAAVMAFHRKYRPRITGYEKYGMQADIEYLEERQQQEGYRFTVTPVGGNQLSKIDRIKRLVPYIEEQRLYLPKNLWKVNYESKRYDFVDDLMRNEIEAFPFMVHDDMLDAMSRLFDVNMIWPKQSEVDEKKGERYVRKETKRRLWGVMAR